MDVFSLKIISPEAILLDDHVTMAVVPGLEGDLGLLPHHAPLITPLRSGLIQTYHEKIKDQLFILSGFLDVNAQGCTILAEECVFIHDLDKDTLERHLQEVMEDIDMSRSEKERLNYVHTSRIIKAKLHVLEQIWKNATT